MKQRIGERDRSYACMCVGKYVEYYNRIRSTSYVRRGIMYITIYTSDI